MTVQMPTAELPAATPALVSPSTPVPDPAPEAPSAPSTAASAARRAVPERAHAPRSSRGAGRAPVSARVVGIDIARFLALIGMMAAHVWTVNADGSPAVVEQIVSGKAAALFAVLAGVGIALTSRRDLAEGRIWAARRNLLGRGLALILIGLTLGFSPSGIVVILVYYGVMFWLAIPMLRWSSTALLIVAGALAIGWPFVSSWLRLGLEQPFELGSASWLSLMDPVSFVRGLFLTGSYPVMTWIVYAMIGMVIGRLVIAMRDGQALRRLGERLAIVGAGIAAAAWGASVLAAGAFGGLDALVADTGLDRETVKTLFYGTGMGAAPSGSPWWLLSPAPHSGTALDLAITTGIAVAVIGLCAMLGTILSGPVLRLLEPLRRAGAAPLTVYTAHVIAASIPLSMLFLQDALPEAGAMPWYLSSGALWALHIAGALLIGAVLMVIGRRGPLEALVSDTGRLFSGARRRERATG